MPSVEEILRRMRERPKDVRFAELCRVCDHFFGKARQQGGSHRIYRTPWTGDPRVNIQGDGGRAKTYQVRQVLQAVALIEENPGEDS